MYELPDGWDLDRVRSHAMGDACLVPLDTTVFVETRDDFVELQPSAIIDFSGLLLVLDPSDGLWYMGQYADADTIVCWASYGDDLAEAIAGL